MSKEGQEKIQVSQEFFDKASNQSEALAGLGQPTFSSNPETPLIERIEVKSSGEGSQPTTKETEVSGQASGAPAGDKPAEASAGDPPPANTDKGQQNAGEAGEGNGEEFVIDSPIFNGKKTITTKKEEAPGAGQLAEFKTIEDFDAFAKSNGFDDSKKLAADLPGLLQIKKDFDVVSSNNKKYETLFEHMPTRLFTAFKDWSNGEDWETKLAAADPLNYETDFSKHDSAKMVDKYFPGKITKEDWEEYNKDDGDQVVKDKVGSYLGLSKDKYASDQEKFKTHKETVSRNATAAVEARNLSMATSREEAKKEFSSSNLNIDDKYIGGLDSILANDRMILSIFKNDDGTLKPDAHKKLAMANDGFGLVVQYQQHIERRVVSKAREEIIERTGSGSQAVSKTGEGAGGQNQLQKSEKKVKDYVNSILPSGEKQAFS